MAIGGPKVMETRGGDGSTPKRAMAQPKLSPRVGKDADRAPALFCVDDERCSSL